MKIWQKCEEVQNSYWRDASRSWQELL